MDQPMGIVGLITEIGDENIKFQNLDTCAISLNHDRKKGNKITFGTDEQITVNGTERIGLVIWLPRDKVAAVMQR